MIDLPDRAVPLYLRLSRANRPYATAEGARQRLQDAILRPRSYGPPRWLRRDVHLEVAHDRHWPVYTLTPATGAAPTGGVVYVHGGGWVNQISPHHWKLAADIAAEAGVTVTVPIYPLLPYGSAAQVGQWVVGLVRRSFDTRGPTCLAGDSAGGQIALSATLQLRDAGTVLPRTVLISPALDLTWSNPRIPVVQPSDPWLGRPGGHFFADAWRGELPITDPVVSPLFGDFTGLGPLSVFSGTRDILNPDAHLLVAKARSAGVQVDFHEALGQVHVYPLVPTRAGREAAQAVVESLKIACRG
ncbi:acetyl esterase/lipase [Kineococcus radiotolerans]|uniref:Acetyl esterase/lipase n=1 Tax=Kineococcus radiotolerans TaxID=131568 RepID=A0A7W4XYQ9_KINRA|nr:alpha/beta hydrolase fold domain-containing protein [Kineococcus radiotolerans]MBB2903318.1 acetyl esterase/lipase [Kineococcus radiotolerans]